MVSGSRSISLPRLRRGALTRYAVWGGQVEFETDSAGTIGNQYVWGPGTDNLLVAKDPTSGTRYFAVTDKLGSIRAWIAQDGTWDGRTRFGPYGKTLIKNFGASDRFPYRWAGRELDKETGLYYLRARYYDPRQMRFTQEDPIGVAGGSNLYAYVGGSPLEARDPSGMISRAGAFGDPCPWGCGGHLNTDGWYGFSGSLLPTKVTDLYLDGKFVERREGWLVSLTTMVTLRNATPSETRNFVAMTSSVEFAMMLQGFENSGVSLEILFVTGELQVFSDKSGAYPTATGRGYDRNGEICMNCGSSSVPAVSVTSYRIFFSRISLANRGEDFRQVMAHEIGHAYQMITSGVFNDDIFADQQARRVLDELLNQSLGI